MKGNILAACAADPLRLKALLWPEVQFYREQEEVIYSVVDNDETYVCTGHMMGKDFVAAFIVLWFFLSRHPCRIITTSADHAQLESVLWGEMRRFIQTARHPLSSDQGGPLVVNHLHLRKTFGKEMCGLSYCIGRVAAKGEGMQGHHVADAGDHLPRTLYLADEASGVDDLSYNAADTWARRKLVLGNPYPCTNFFKRFVLAGNLAAPPRGAPLPSTYISTGGTSLDPALTPPRSGSPTGSLSSALSGAGASTHPGQHASTQASAHPSTQASAPTATAGGPWGNPSGSEQPPRHPHQHYHQQSSHQQPTPPTPPPTPPPTRYYRRVIHFSAEDSPNVRLAMAELAAGRQPSGTILVPGVLPYDEYVKRMTTWDPVMICIGLQGRFYEGPTELLYPPLLLNKAEGLARLLASCCPNPSDVTMGPGGQPRTALGIGVDPAAGGDRTVYAAADEWGLIELLSHQTPDTNVIAGEVLAFMRRHGASPEQVCIDAGGGGQQIADRLRAQGYKVRTVGFGEAATPPPARGMLSMAEQQRRKGGRLAYANRRAELYGRLRELLQDGYVPPGGDPLEALPLPLPARTAATAGTGASTPAPGSSGRSEAGAGVDTSPVEYRGWALPPRYDELRRQLSLMPLLYDDEGRLYLPPKRRRRGQVGKSLEEILGCSPDEADAVVLSVYAMIQPRRRVKVGAMW